MPFDMGFDFREHVAYVTDPTYSVSVDQVSGFEYPITFTNDDGYSVNAGRAGGTTFFQLDVNSAWDPRIAGVNYGFSSGSYWQVDLSSGSAPGAGDYTADVAFGYQSATLTQAFELFDNTTRLIDGTNGGSGFSVTAGSFLDASLAIVAGSGTWGGTPVPVTFATTTVKLIIQYGYTASFWAHFRLTLDAGGGTNTDITVPSALRLV